MGALLDRAAETAAVEGVLAAVRDGLSGVLVLRGEAGVGKTTLLDHAVQAAGDMRVARVTGVESEMDLGFAGLHLLVVPFLGDGLAARYTCAIHSRRPAIDRPPSPLARPAHHQRPIGR